MQVEDLPVSGFVKQSLQEDGITALNEPQERAVENGVLDGESMIVSSPTASGKTLIASLAAAKTLEQPDAKVLYLVPLKALGSEKHGDYQDFFADTTVETAVSVGRSDSNASWLADKDFIILTVEKLDSLLRHGAYWITDVDLVVTDEIHLLNDKNRGPTLEIVLTRLKRLLDAQFLGLSATVSNAEELADWLDCSLVESDYRPVDLWEGVALNNEITFYHDTTPTNPEEENDMPDGFMTAADKATENKVRDEHTETTTISSTAKPPMNLVEDTDNKEKQCIVFVNSRRSAESQAEKAATHVTLDSETEQVLEDVADDVENVLESPTKQCKRLADCIRGGAAFHHAGLLPQQRTLIENHFRSGDITAICATPTLAAGVSLPAYRIIIRDVKRFTGRGMSFIPTLEYKQMAGRAGRPEHHDKGEAVAVAKKPGMKNEIVDRYIRGDLEQLYSKVGVEPVLRMHALSLIASNVVNTMKQLTDFFSDTFYAHQYGDLEDITDTLEDLVRDYIAYGFVEETGGTLEATTLGERIAELYIDPLTAKNLLEGLKKSEDSGAKLLSYVHLLCNTQEMQPWLRVKKGEKEEIDTLIEEFEPFFLTAVPSHFDYEYDDFREAFKTALFFMDWMDEDTEDELMEQYGITPGGIHARKRDMDWLLYAADELCTLQEWEDAQEIIRRLRTRIKYGVKQELLSLIKLDHIGRVRARKLYNQGIETAADIRDAESATLRKLLGKKTAKKIQEQVGGTYTDREKLSTYFAET